MKYIFAIVYRRWLWRDTTRTYDRVVRVKGWRTAIVEDTCGHRSTVSPCFLWFK